LKVEVWNDNEILRKVSDNIKTSEYKKYVKLGNQMIKYIKNPKHWWVGLAAPQIWCNKRLIVVSMIKDWESDDSFKTIMMMNPVIVDHSDSMNQDVEWCLSVPWKKWKVSRYNSIKLIYMNEKWQERTLILDSLRARIIQHEIDHLDGILFTDKLV